MSSTSSSRTLRLHAIFSLWFPPVRPSSRPKPFPACWEAHTMRPPRLVKEGILSRSVALAPSAPTRWPARFSAPPARLGLTTIKQGRHVVNGSNCPWNLSLGARVDRFYLLTFFQQTCHSHPTLCYMGSRGIEGTNAAMTLSRLGKCLGSPPPLAVVILTVAGHVVWEQPPVGKSRADVISGSKQNLSTKIPLGIFSC